MAPSHHENNDYALTMFSPLTQLMDGALEFIKTFSEWRRVALISQDEEMFRKVPKNFRMANKNTLFFRLLFTLRKN